MGLSSIIRNYVGAIKRPDGEPIFAVVTPRSQSGIVPYIKYSVREVEFDSLAFASFLLPFATVIKSDLTECDYSSQASRHFKHVIVQLGVTAYSNLAMVRRSGDLGMYFHRAENGAILFYYALVVMLLRKS